MTDGMLLPPGSGRRIQTMTLKAGAEQSTVFSAFEAEGRQPPARRMSNAPAPPRFGPGVRAARPIVGVAGGGAPPAAGQAGSSIDMAWWNTSRGSHRALTCCSRG
jgi:hypothetical protein